MRRYRGRRNARAAVTVDYSQYTLDELVTLARSRGIKAHKGWKPETIIAKLGG